MIGLDVATSHTNRPSSSPTMGKNATKQSTLNPLTHIIQSLYSNTKTNAVDGSAINRSLCSNSMNRSSNFKTKVNAPL